MLVLLIINIVGNEQYRLEHTKKKEEQLFTQYLYKASSGHNEQATQLLLALNIYYIK